MNENEQAEPMDLVPDLVLGEYFRLIREATTVDEVRRIVEENFPRVAVTELRDAHEGVAQ
jgi:hypothetical protein